MKNKIISLFLACFLVVSTTVGSYAESRINSRAIDGGIISAPMLAVIATLAVATGITLSSNDDIYDLGAEFYKSNQDNWEEVENLFKATVTISANGLVNAGKDFIKLVKDTFDKITSPGVIGTISGFPYLGVLTYSKESRQKIIKHGLKVVTPSTKGIDFKVGNLIFKYSSNISETRGGYDVYLGDTYLTYTAYDYGSEWYFACITNQDHKMIVNAFDSDIGSQFIRIITNSNAHYDAVINGYEIPYEGTYSPGGVLDTDKDVGVYVPGNVGNLVGQGSNGLIHDGTFAPPYDLPSDGVVTLPGVDSPSIGIGGITSIPSDGVLNPPTDTPTDTTWDWLINLVVPGETYFTDTFSSKLELAQSKLPFLDLTPLQKLACGETPFPNIDIKIMGSNVSRILNSDDTLNKVVSFFRPIIQAFVSVFMLLYGYNQIYFLIRGTYPIKLGRGSDD